MNQKTSRLIYSPISSNQIRLVEIQPGEDDETACFLETVDRDKASAYRVLSYVWGSQGDPKTILLNNQPWKVTRNLEAVLRHLRETPSEQRIWIDALSINQSDIPERNAQVSEMRQVYSSASFTILWLGTDPTPSISKLLEMASLCYNSENLSDGSWLGWSRSKAQ
ncbi:hypothetical protein N431DRAFT_232514 [Stipitochalara longipes BDJ]|nr:hypothetical protein N431DRAFT_232514 [Stipitochalara longipes BDJ]